MNRSIAGLCLVFVGTSLAMPAVAASDRLDPAQRKTGINLAADQLYSDAIHQARTHWTVPSDPWGSTYATVDALGWPTQDATLVVWEGRAFNQGTYRLTFNGKATVSTFDAGPVAPQNADGTTGTYDAASNTTTATMVVTDTQAENFALTLANSQRTAASAKGTGFTNVHLYRPRFPGAKNSYDPGEIFTRQARLMAQKFAVIRFMDQFAVIGSTVTNWAERNPPTAWNYTPMPYELAVRLCNTTGCDLYVNVPYFANDDYITKLAQLIRFGSDGTNPYTAAKNNPVWAPLRADLHVYLEYSNELWNFGQPQAGQNLDAVKADQGANNAEWSVLNYDGTGGNNIYYAGWRRVALGVKHISDLFRVVYGDALMPPNANATVRPLLEFQASDGQETGTQQLTFLDDYFNNGDGTLHVPAPHPVNYFLWGGGGATYYTSNNDNASTVDDLFASGIPSSGSNNTINYALATLVDTDWTVAYGLKRVAYEGGWSVYNGSNGFSNVAGSAADNAKYDARAQTTQQNAQTIFTQAGGSLNIFYTSSSFAHTYVWGMTDSIFNLNVPLYQAIDAINAQMSAPAITNGIPISATDPTTLRPGSQQAEDNIDGNNTVFGMHSQGEVIFLPLVATAGKYEISLDVGGVEEGQKLCVKIDGTPVETSTEVPMTYAPNTTPVYDSVIVGTVYLTARQHGLLLRGLPSEAGGYDGYSGNVKDIVLTPSN